MDLISKVERDILELNSWERAIIWGALTLRSSLVSHAESLAPNGFSYKNAVRITLSRAIVEGALTANLRIEATFDYNSINALSGGGTFLLGVSEFYSGSAELYVGTSCSIISSEGYKTTAGGSGLPDDPVYIDTLEEYFLWCCWQAELSLLSPLPSQLLPITVDFFEESRPNPTLKVVANIPIDYEAYKDSENLICSCLPFSSQISPAGPRSFSWEEIVNKPSFATVATSGNYTDLINPPSIPSSLDELNRFNEMVRSINNTTPDPVTGNVDLTLNVGTVEWVNVTNKPTFSTVAFSGDYNDLINPPALPSYEWVNILNKPTFSTVAFSGDYADLINTPSTVSSDWGSITNKPTFSTVAFSGSYNDLSDKPTISGGSGGNSSYLIGTILLSTLSTEDNYTNIPFSSNGYNGIIDWIGTNKNTESYTNPHNSGLVVVSNSPSNSSRLFALTDHAIQSVGFIYGQQMDLIIDFTKYTFIPSQISLLVYNFNHNVPSTHEVRLSNDLVNWDVWGEFIIDTSNSAGVWKNVVNSTTMSYRYLNIKYKSGHTSSLYTDINEIEIYGDVSESQKLISYGNLFNLIYRDSAVFSIKLFDPALSSIGDYFVCMNPFGSDLEVVPFSNEVILSDSNLSVIPANSSKKIVKVGTTEWGIL